MLSGKEKRRFSRQIMLSDIGETGQEAIKSAKVLVVGAGGLGCPVLQYLTAAGIGSLGIVEFDQVNESNLHRQILYGCGDIGKLKSIIAKNMLEKISELTDIEIYNLRLTASNAEKIITPWNIIVDATDNFETRYVIDNACLKQGKPMIHGAIYKNEGQVSVFNYNGAGSYSDYNPFSDSNVRDPSPAENGLFGMLPGVTGGIMAMEVIKIITGTGDVLAGKVFTFNIASNSFYIFNIPRQA
jgi:adenylyltransferase/sulfurtransferase